MLSELEISNFKQFDNIKLKNLSRINVIGGMNNTGKSSLLEAIFTLYDRGSPDLTLKQYAWRGLVNLSLDRDNIWSPIFKDYDFKKTIVIKSKDDTGVIAEAKIDYGKNNKRIQNSYVMGSNNFSNKSKSNSQEGLLVSYKMSGKNYGDMHIVFNGQQITANYDNLLPIDKPVIYLSSSMKGDAALNAEYFTQLDRIKNLEPVVEALKIIEPRLQSLSLGAIAGSSQILADVGMRLKIPVSLLGEGVSKILSIILALLSNKKSIILIDEIENGIYYRTFPVIWKYILNLSKQNDNQIFVTTHSYETLVGLVQSAVDLNSEDVSYYRFDRTDTTKSTQYNLKELITSLESNWEVR